MGGVDLTGIYMHWALKQTLVRRRDLSVLKSMIARTALDL